MKVKELIILYQDAKTEKDKNEVIANLVYKKYIPIDTKKTIIELAINALTSNENGLVIYDSIYKHMLFYTITFNLYYDLEFEEESIDYDLIMENNLLIQLMHQLGSDVLLFQELFELRLEDYLEHNNTIESVVNNGIQNLLQFAVVNMDKITSKISDLDSERLISIFDKFSAKEQE